MGNDGQPLFQQPITTKWLNVNNHGLQPMELDNNCDHNPEGG